MKRYLYVLLIMTFLGTRSGYGAIDPKEQMQIILFSGLGGAVLGLSTLSFYSEPQDHLRNIAIGGAVALVGSVVFTTVLAAKESKAEAAQEGTDGSLTPDNKATPSSTPKKAPSAPKSKTSGDTKDDDYEYYDDEDEDSYHDTGEKPYMGIFLADISDNKLSINPYTVYLV
ncbi:MAG: hypothetical protein JXA66_05705, partial [Oligoflexia bacterium]|nr:hypothetical protein [Oligoflexia bacterium]